MPKKASKIVTTENDTAPTPVSVPATKTVAQTIKEEYDNGAYSPLQLALKHNVEVDVVKIEAEVIVADRGKQLSD